MEELQNYLKIGLISLNRLLSQYSLTWSLAASGEHFVNCKNPEGAHAFDYSMENIYSGSRII
jgi:hypothetical protein